MEVDRDTEICCDSVTQLLIKGKRKISRCCGTEVFNMRTHRCCKGPKTSNIFRDRIQGCCNGIVFDPATQKCVGQIVVDLDPELNGPEMGYTYTEPEKPANYRR